MSDLIKPKTIKLRDLDGDEHEFIVSRYPATVATEILVRFGSSLPKTSSAEELMEFADLAFAYVAKEIDGVPVRLTTRALRDNHIPAGYDPMLRLIVELTQHNTNFLSGAGNRGLKGYLLDLIQDLAPQITKTLAQFSQQSSANDTQHSQSSKPRSTSKKR